VVIGIGILGVAAVATHVVDLSALPTDITGFISSLTGAPPGSSLNVPTSQNQSPIIPGGVFCSGPFGSLSAMQYYVPNLTQLADSWQTYVAIQHGNSRWDWNAFRLWLTGLHYPVSSSVFNMPYPGFCGQ